MTENYVQDIKNKHHQDERLRSEQITAIRVSSLFLYKLILFVRDFSLGILVTNLQCTKQ